MRYNSPGVIIIQLPRMKRSKFMALTIYPFVFIADRKKFFANAINMRHERIHARQQLEMLWVFFFVWYAIEFAIRALNKGWWIAYRNVSFEDEAYYYQDSIK